MLGAIIGDIVGSTREWHNIKTEDFEWVPQGSRFTDDTVMTLAVAKWLMDDPLHDADRLVGIMQELGRDYPDAGYGSMFRKWLHSDDPQPYGSYGNGSAMRVSPVGMYAHSLEEALELARITALVSHDHPEGIKGAQAIAACVYLQRNEENDAREKIKRYIEDTFGYNLDIRLEDIRDEYRFDSSCQGSVPIAIMAFLQRDNAVDALRLAISMGGDSDTIGCMTTAIASARPTKYNNLPDSLIERCRALLTPTLLEINDRFETFVMYTREYTPKWIMGLKPNEIFVFGSNLGGYHGGGAARVAMEKFGAIWGQGVGLQGQSYAIPTMQGGVETIKPYVDEFIAFAKAHPEYKFFVTKIGCGIAGFRVEEIAPLFYHAIDCENIVLPKEFDNIIQDIHNRFIESFDKDADRTSW